MTEFREKIGGVRRLYAILRVLFTFFILITVMGLFVVLRDSEAAAELTRAEPDSVPQDAEFVALSEKIAKPVYAEHCAACHGAGMQGDHGKGVPSLADSVFLYQSGRVSEIERIILYGIRSGHGKAQNTTDMPGLGVDQQITLGDVRDAHAYLKTLAGDRTQDPQAVGRGEFVYQNKGQCYDCHAGDALGNSDYGAPNLIDREVLYGSDDAAFEHSTYYGRHGVCPAWIGKLDPSKIRALAVYLHTKAQPRAREATP